MLWQAKAWADLVVCLEWAGGPFKIFLESAGLANTDTLLLADNLRSQAKQEFADKLKTECRSDLQFGPKGATYIWQPIDRHIGNEYKRRMAKMYDEWMQTDFECYANGHVTAGQRRVLMTK